MQGVGAFPIVLHEFRPPKMREVKFNGLMGLADPKKKSEMKAFIQNVTERRKNIQSCLKAKPKRYSECSEEIREYLQLIQAFKISSVKDNIRKCIQFTWRSGFQNSRKRRVQFRSIEFEEIMMSWLYGICLINSSKQILKRSATLTAKDRCLSPKSRDEYHVHIIRALRLAGGVFSHLSLDLIPSFYLSQQQQQPISPFPRYSSSSLPSSPRRSSPFPSMKQKGSKKKSSKGVGVSGFSNSAGIFDFEPFLSEDTIDEDVQDGDDRPRSRTSSSSKRKSGNDMTPLPPSNGEMTIPFFELDSLSAYSIRCYCTSAAQMIKLYSISSGMIRKRERIEKSFSLTNSPATPQQRLIRGRLKKRVLLEGNISTSSTSSSSSSSGSGEDSSMWIASVAARIFKDLDECFSSLVTLQRKKKYLEKKMEVDHQFWLFISQYRIIYRAVTLQQLAIHYYNLDEFGICCTLISRSLRQIKEIQVFRVIKRNQLFLKEVEKFILGIALLERKYFHENKIFFQDDFLDEIPKDIIPVGKHLITIKPHIVDKSSVRMFLGYLKAGGKKK